MEEENEKNVLFGDAYQNFQHDDDQSGRNETVNQNFPQINEMFEKLDINKTYSKTELNREKNKKNRKNSVSLKSSKNLENILNKKTNRDDKTQNKKNKKTKTKSGMEITLESKSKTEINNESKKTTIPIYEEFTNETYLDVYEEQNMPDERINSIYREVNVNQNKPSYKSEINKDSQPMLERLLPSK